MLVLIVVENNRVQEWQLIESIPESIDEWVAKFGSDKYTHVYTIHQDYKNYWELLKLNKDQKVCYVEIDSRCRAEYVTHVESGYICKEVSKTPRPNTDNPLDEPITKGSTKKKATKKASKLGKSSIF